MEFVQYFTKFSDYLSNQKIIKKDIACINKFIDPFKWGYIMENK